jgi:hypothetical protein
MFGNGAQLANLTGYTRARISQFEKEGTIKREKNRLFNLEKSAAAIGRPIQLTEEQKADSGPIDFTEWRNLKMKEDALISQTERQIIQGDLLDREAVVREIGAAFHSAKTKLLTIPTSVAGIVATETDASVIKEIIEGLIREALAEIGTAAARFGSSLDNETPAEAHG